MSSIFRLALEDHNDGPWTQLEVLLGFQVHEELVDAIERNQIQIPDHRVFSGQEIYERYKSRKADWDAGFRVRMMVRADEYTQRDVWNPGWLEIAERIANYDYPEYHNPNTPETLSVDFAPTDKGQGGQVILTGHTTSRVRVFDNYETLIQNA